jgi:hypothetical protein
MYKPKLNNEKKTNVSGQIMSLLSNMYKKIIFIRFLFTTLGTTKRISGGIMELFMGTIHGEIFENHFTMKTFK